MLRDSNRLIFSTILAVAILLLLFTITLSYFLVVEAVYSADWKETRKFNLSIKTCEEAERKAEEDFKNGKIKMYFDGGTSEGYPDKFPYNFYRQLEEEFGIDVIDTGHLGSSFYKCYNLRMDNLLDEKTGHRAIEDLFNKLRDEEYPT